jgi:Phage portal protein
MDIQTRNGLTFGRFATEMIYDRSVDPDEEGNYPFHRFRPIDVATIVRTVRKGEYVGNNLRATAIRALESITGEKINIDINLLQEDRYAWMQVIDGTPRQAFTHDEMLVFTLFPSTDVEHNGYPISPLDTVVSSVTTHISIDAYKKLYFQNGRATKGMLIIQSDEVDQQTLDNMKLQFNASINSVSNSFRTPIFGIGTEDNVTWLPMVGEGLGDEFQFMYDQIARNILSAFGISPDELPGYGHLSKGTNSQTLSESNNEFKLTASRDSGLRPLILKFQIFINQRLMPIIDPLLAKICVVKLSGLDASSKEQETTRLQQDMVVSMAYDEVLHEVDKEPIGQVLGGKFPFNERWQLLVDKYKNVGDLLGPLMGSPSAIVDPLLRYKRDPFWLQYLQLLASVNPAAVQAYFAPRPFAMEFLKMQIQDDLDGEDNI